MGFAPRITLLLTDERDASGSPAAFAETQRHVRALEDHTRNGGDGSTSWQEWETDYTAFEGGIYSLSGYGQMLHILAKTKPCESTYSWVEHCRLAPGLDYRKHKPDHARSRCAAGHKAMCMKLKDCPQSVSHCTRSAAGRFSFPPYRYTTRAM